MQLQIFEYESDQEVRTVEIDGEVWWVAKDVCRILGISNVSEALIELDSDEKKNISKTDVGFNISKLRAINEPGLYHLIFKSRKPEAKKFKKWVTSEVLPQIRKTGVYRLRGSAVPAFIKRYNENWDRVELGYFSVISELVIRIYGRLEQIGYNMPDRGKKGREIRPDVSVGKTFSKWLKENHPEKADEFKFYTHILPDGLEVEARQYKNSVWAEFIEFVETVWLRERSYKYFKERDEKALDYLPKLIPDFKSPRGITSRRKIKKAT